MKHYPLIIAALAIAMCACKPEPTPDPKPEPGPEAVDTTQKEPVDTTHVPDPPAPPAPTAPGLRTAEDLVEFAQLYNAGDASKFDPDGDGVYVLEADIDLTGVTWTPIGNPKTQTAIPYNTTEALADPFTGVFDGAGHKITGLSMFVNIQTTQTMGLFGSISGATVKNLTIEDAKLSVSGSGICTNHVALGFVSGMTVESTIENVHVTGTIDGFAVSTASRNVAVGGITGFMLNTAKTSTIKDCSFGGKVTLDVGEKYSNNSTTMFAGIVGGVSSVSKKLLYLTNCTNNAEFKVKSHRCAGIICNAFFTIADGCVNNGHIECDYSDDYVANVTGVRMGGIMAYCSSQGNSGQTIQNCVNNGDIVTEEAGSVAGGVCGLIKCYSVKNCTNNGNVVGPVEGRGLLIGIFQSSTTLSTVSGCSVTGKVGTKRDLSGLVPSTTGNYLRLGASFAAGVTCPTYTSANVKYIGTIDAPDQGEGGSEGGDDVKLPEMTKALPSIWHSSSKTTTQNYWTTSLHCMPATDGTAATITVQRGAANASVPFTYSLTNYAPYVNGMVKDDYWLFTFMEPVSAGEYIQFNTNITAGGANSHKYWLLEWEENGTWKSDPNAVCTAPEDASIKYTTRIYYASAYQYSTVSQIIKLGADVKELKIRLRAVGTQTSGGGTESINASSATVFLCSQTWWEGYATRLKIDPAKKKIRVLCLGNSFTYYYMTSWKLQEIAGSQGHEIDMHTFQKGSQNLGNHTTLLLAQEEINKGGYGYIFLQDQSQGPANYASDPVTNASTLTNCNTLAAQVRAKSPSAQLILENTWSYTGSSYGGFTSLANFDKLLAEGTMTMAKSISSWISPIGQAFTLCRSKYPAIKLNYTDDKHQSNEGAYLKACVNYLVLFGEKFDSNVSNCDLDPADAAKLRAIAEEVVLGNESNYLITR